MAVTLVMHPATGTAHNDGDWMDRPGPARTLCGIPAEGWERRSVQPFPPKVCRSCWHLIPMEAHRD